jgi:TPR repeat protein
MKKKYIYFFILLFMVVGCNFRKEKGIPVNYSEIPDWELEKLVIEKGDTSAYYDLFVVYLDYSFEKFLPYALIMANRYNYPQAYYDVYDRLWNLYENPDTLDTTTKKMALEYLEKAAKMGHSQAKQTLEEYHNPLP